MKLYKLLIILGITLLPAFAFAAEDIFDSNAYSTDLSIQYLSMIFGNVEGTVVTGGGFQTLKTVLTSFNTAIMSLGGIIVLYSMIVSVVNTAHDGEMLGREWSSIWIPLRTAMGFALLLPVKGSTSYSVIQVFVMWIVTQGVYAADYLWEISVDSVLAGEAKPIDIGPNNVEVATFAQKVFENLVCVKQASISLNTEASNLGPVNRKYVYGLEGSYKPNDICGNIEATVNPQETVNMVNNLDSYANEFVTQYNDNASISSELDSSIKLGIEAASKTYIQEVTAAAAAESTKSEQADFLAKMKEQGWAMAGSSFLTLAQVTNDQSSTQLTFPDVTLWRDIHEPINSEEPAINKYLSDSVSFMNEMDLAAGVATNEEYVVNNPNEMSEFLSGQLAPIQGLFLDFLYWWTQSISGQSYDEDSETYSQSNPLIVIMNTGITITRIVITAYAIFVGVMIAFGAAAYAAGQSVFGFVGFGAIWGGLLTAMNFMTAPIMVLMGTFLSIGITWGFYVPLIPYIIFTMGVIGWFILVIEAMVAAPLMAIGVLHPEGKHTVFGEAHAGIMIIAGVFLRPALMIVGLIAALIMTYVVVVIISIGFLPVATQISASNVSIVGTLVMMVLYTMLILIGLNKAFSLIHVLPDKIMRWIGQPGEQGDGAQGELNELKGGAGGVEKGLSDTKQMGAEGANDIKKEGERQKEKHRKEQLAALKSNGSGMSAK